MAPAGLERGARRPGDLVDGYPATAGAARMKSVAFAEHDLAELHRQAAEQPFETCAVGFVHRAGNHRDGPRFTVREVGLAPESAYLERSPVRASLAPDFLVAVANKARELQAGVVFLHTHPGLHSLEGFSGTD